MKYIYYSYMCDNVLEKSCVIHRSNEMRPEEHDTKKKKKKKRENDTIIKKEE